MTPHIEASLGDYADTVLMPGDPVRATYIAEKFLTNIRKINGIRNCTGYTGMFKGQPISIQASGMGQPSLGIYATELFDIYNVQRIIRVGTCGAFNSNININDLVIPITASSDSLMGSTLFKSANISAVCCPSLLQMVLKSKNTISSKIHIGSFFSTDNFYHYDNEWWHIYRDAGVLGIDMETHFLYLLAMKKKRQALTINVVSDNLVNGEKLTPSERVNQTDSACHLILRALFDN